MDLEGSDQYEILTQREEMVLGSASERETHLNYTVCAVIQSYNSGSMFAYVAHGDFAR